MLLRREVYTGSVYLTRVASILYGVDTDYDLFMLTLKFQHRVMCLTLSRRSVRRLDAGLVRAWFDN
jgi:hypothetical protein